MQALMIYTSKCNNLNILRFDVLFIFIRLINVLFLFITQLLVGYGCRIVTKFNTHNLYSIRTFYIQYTHFIFNTRRSAER